MTDWLLGTLLATSGLIVLVLLVREPVRRHFGARVAYGLWLIPAARLLMPTLTETVERPVTLSVSPRLMTGQVSVEPLLMSSITPARPSLIEQVGGWPAVLLTLWLGIAFGLFAARMLAFRRERDAILGDCEQLGSAGSIRLVRSAEVSGPVAFGIFDRVIAVPADFERFTPRTSAGWRSSMSLPTTGRATSSSTSSPLSSSASSGSTRSPGWLTPLFASTRKRRVTPGCWTRPRPTIAPTMAGRSPRPLRDERCCSHRRSIVAKRSTGGSSPCLPIPVPAAAKPAE